MAAQVTVGMLSKAMGGQLAGASDKYRDAPIDTGMLRLPAPIKNGLAKLTAIAWFVQEKEGGFVPKGKVYCQARAVVLEPKEFGGMKLEGRASTTQFIPLCATPEKGKRAARTFDENFGDFINLLKVLSDGKMVCPHTPKDDPTGVKSDQFYHACMTQLLDVKNPVYISFSTRGYTPPKTPLNPKPEEQVYETWHGTAKPQDTFDPGAGVNVQAQPTVNSDAAPEMGADGFPANPADADTVVTEELSLADELDQLVEIVEADPDGATEEGAAAARRIEELAWDRGWTEEETSSAANWIAVAKMALHGREGFAAVEQESKSVSVGDKVKFCKRDGKGEKLKNKQNEPFPPLEYEVVSVDADAGTCSLKSTRDGKPLIDLKTKQPIAVKLEWLE